MDRFVRNVPSLFCDLRLWPQGEHWCLLEYIFEERLWPLIRDERLSARTWFEKSLSSFETCFYSPSPPLFPLLRSLLRHSPSRLFELTCLDLPISSINRFNRFTGEQQKRSSWRCQPSCCRRWMVEQRFAREPHPRYRSAAAGRRTRCRGETRPACCARILCSMVCCLQGIVSKNKKDLWRESRR